MSARPTRTSKKPGWLNHGGKHGTAAGFVPHPASCIPVTASEFESPFMHHPATGSEFHPFMQHHATASEFHPYMQHPMTGSNFYAHDSMYPVPMTANDFSPYPTAAGYTANSLYDPMMPGMTGSNYDDMRMMRHPGQTSWNFIPGHQEGGPLKAALETYSMYPSGKYMKMFADGVDYGATAGIDYGIGKVISMPFARS